MNSRADWAEELRQAFRTSHELAQFLGWDIPELSHYPLLVPRKLARQIREDGPQGVLARQFLPLQDETRPDGLLDPIADQVHAKTSQLIHRYHNRVLLLPTTSCPVNCRFCFRKNELQLDTPFAPDRARSLEYLRQHSEVEEVIFTGGDPLILSEEKLDQWLRALADIPHIRFVRFHSRVPVILPSRLTEELLGVLKAYAPRFSIALSVHTNHQLEWSQEAVAAVARFRAPGISWLAQSVLLKGVNDSTDTLRELFCLLHSLAIRPYYLHHPDPVKGGMHFYLSLEEGRRIWAPMHNFLPGWLLPQYVMEAPEGMGKIPAFNPESLSYSGRLLTRAGEEREFLLSPPPASEHSARA